MYSDVFVAVPFSGGSTSAGNVGVAVEVDNSYEVSASLSRMSVNLALAA